MTKVSVRGIVLCGLVAFFVSALWIAAYENVKHQPCTHGESSAAVAIYGGHVHVIRDVAATGCTR